MLPITVAGSLRLEVFGRVDFTVYAGDSMLDTPIRWVHPTEISDIARFLTGGEMLLTAGIGIKTDPGAQLRYIEQIADAGAAVLVIELSGRAYDEMPLALIEAARRREFPLVGLHGELPFVEISAQIHEMRVDRRISELTAYEQLNAKFMHLLLNGRDYVPFTATLAEEVGHAVVLEDASRQVTSYSGASPYADEVLLDWEHHSRIDHEPAHPVTREVAEAGCTRRAVILRGERWGWLHVLHGSAPLIGTQVYALDRATDGIAIALLGARESGAKAAQRQNSLISRLLLGDIAGETFVNRALRIGRDLRGRHLLVILLFKDSRPAATGEEAVSEFFRNLRMPAVVSDVGDHTMAIVGLGERDAESGLVLRLTDLGVTAGLSQLVDAADLPRAVEQARSAVSVAAARPDNAVERFDDLGVLRLLASLAKGPELARYIEDELSPLLQHDATASFPLLPTLRTYLACDGNKTQAAQTLFVQRRTLYYRLERITSILRRSLDDPDARQALVFAVRGYDLLQRQGRPGRPPT